MEADEFSEINLQLKWFKNRFQTQWAGVWVGLIFQFSLVWKDGLVICYSVSIWFELQFDFEPTSTFN